MAIPNNIDPTVTSGTQLATAFNSLVAAFKTMNLATSRDAALTQGGVWVDSNSVGSNILYIKIFDGADDIILFTIDISANTVTLPTATNSISISKVSADAVAPILNLLKSRIASSGQVNTGDSLGEIIWQGKDNTGATRSAARLRSSALENFTSSANGAELILEVIIATQSAYTEILRVKNGLVGFGTSSPATAVHVKSTTGIKSETASTDNATGARLVLRKIRSSTNGQVVSADTLGVQAFNSTDQTGAEIVEAASIEAVALETHSSTVQGTALDFYTRNTGTTTKTKQMRVADTGVAIIPLLDITGAGQIKFPATANPSANANTLDDYEKGTFTPIVRGSGTAGVVTYVNQMGVYTKIGQVVTFTAYVSWTNITGTPTGNMQVAGLPFTSNATSLYWHSVAVYNNGTAVASNGQLQGIITNNTTYVDMGFFTDTTGVTSGVAVDTTGAFCVTGHYVI